MEAKNQIDNLMIAANCNTVFSAIAFNRTHKIIAYTASNTVLIMDPYHIYDNIPKVLFQLKGHNDRVNALSWLTDRILVSISSDKSIIIWSFEKDSNHRIPTSWKLIKVYNDAHNATINYLKTFSIQNELYITTMCANGTLKLWQGDSETTITFKNEILFGKNLQEAIGMMQYGQKHILLVVGGYDAKIHVYLFPRMPYQNEEDKKLFKYKFSLLGHLNEIKDFAFTDEIENNIRYMASCSQDQNIRIWKIQPLQNISESLGGHEDLRQYESKTSYVLQDQDESQVYNITLESVLSHHQASISSIQWGRRSDIKQEQSFTLKDYCLLSSSFDFTVCIWKPDIQTGIWQIDSTLGAMSGNKHAFYGAIFLQDDMQILAYTYNGAMHQWKKRITQDYHQWIPQLTVKGHFGEVSDLDWDQYDSCLITTSQDQTTRLFSQYKENYGWFEIGRPQVHGYDMNTVYCLRVNSTQHLPSKILSGGDEKVLRLFEAPYSFVKTFNSLNPYAKEINLKYSETRSNEEVEKLLSSEAKKQPLGLMNKPIMLEKAGDDEEGLDPSQFDPTKFLSNVKEKQDEIIEELQEPPLEDVLMTRTLWPEVQKLYGHAYEVFSIATTLQGDCAASACKAKEKKYADIVIWDLRKGQSTIPCCKLTAHNLTVVQLEFSKDGQYLLSCSRDRSWALFKRKSQDLLDYTLVKKQVEAHTRIIWGIAWSHDDALFVTASREKTKSVKVWKGITNVNENEQGIIHSELLEGNPSATAVHFFPSLTSKQNYSIIVGLESGDMIVWTLNNESKIWLKVFEFPQYYQHCSSVKRIKFNAKLSNNDKDEYTLATCGSDHTVRIFKIKLY